MQGKKEEGDVVINTMWGVTLKSREPSNDKCNFFCMKKRYLLFWQLVDSAMR